MKKMPFWCDWLDQVKSHNVFSPAIHTVFWLTHYLTNTKFQMAKPSKNFSLLITGQILSRVSQEDYGSLIFWLKESRENFGEIIISTWANEVNEEIRGLVDFVVLNEDPGLDESSLALRPSNKKRHMVQTISGLSACNFDIIFRVRVEFAKMNQEIVSDSLSRAIINALEFSPIKLICPAPGTISAKSNGCPFFLADTFLIASRICLIDWYQQMSKDFEKYESTWFRHRFLVEPLAIEQIFGLAVVQNLNELALDELEVSRLNRIFVTRKTFQFMKKSFSQQVMLFNPNVLGIHGGRWLNYNSNWENLPMFLDLQFTSWGIFRILGIKYALRKRLRPFFIRFLP